MFIPFESLSQESSILIFYSEIELSEEIETEIKQELVDFLFIWKSHGEDVQASIESREAHFFIIGFEKNTTSGCSLDSLLRKIKEINERFSVDLFCRKIPYIFQNTVQFFDRNERKERIKNQSILPTTMIINTIISQKKQLGEWKIEAQKSWIGNLFEIQSIN